MLVYSKEFKLFVWQGPFESRSIPRQAGFKWHEQGKRYVTHSPYIAYALLKYASRNAYEKLFEVHENMILSQENIDTKFMIPAPEGLKYYSYQSNGIEQLSWQLLNKRGSIACCDEQGLGKTITAIGVANMLGFKRLLVICPAALRLNWVREIEKWHVQNIHVVPILNSKDLPSSLMRTNPEHPLTHSLVTSYELAGNIQDSYIPDFIIVDEIHYLKSHKAKRTRTVLGDMRRKNPGLINKAPSILLSGTPFPNGKPSELWPVLYRCAPDIIDYMRYWPFLRRFGYIKDNGYGIEIKSGVKHSQELYTRLRGSGFMVRRLKQDVLKELPPKRYQMIVFNASKATRKILQREKNFKAEEIIRHGVPVGSALPEIRRAMGLAKIPECLEYIVNMLNSGVQKLLVFAHHIDVNHELYANLSFYGAVKITGSTSPTDRQEAVDRFQNDPECRVLVGNIKSAGTGFTLTKAHDVIFAECSWIPGENEQAVDRCHRIGQKERVLVHYLVVENSLDARILSVAAKKAANINQTLDRKE